MKSSQAVMFGLLPENQPITFRLPKKQMSLDTKPEEPYTYYQGVIKGVYSVHAEVTFYIIQSLEPLPDWDYSHIVLSRSEIYVRGVDA